jgi:hypothetical protein
MTFPARPSVLLSLALIGSLTVAGCNRHSGYLYVHPSSQAIKVSTGMPDLANSTGALAPLDIFWVIGGMTEQAQNFQNGVTSFMTNFVAQPDWRMAVVGDDEFQAPLLGLTSVFDFTDPNAIQDFVQAVMNAVNGADGEVLFDPTVKNLTQYPHFVRPNADLVIILTNDAFEKSTTYTKASQMVSFLKGLKGGHLGRVRVYGVIGATDLNCDPATIDGDWDYHGSEMEALINTTGGQVYSLCDASFGDSLAKIGGAITAARHYILPWISLAQTPIPASLHVFYEGNELPGGPQVSGGIWYYDGQRNAIVFYNLNFSTNANATADVQFDQDLGIQ